MRILLVEDNADHRELMSLALTGYDPTWQVEEVASGEEGLRHLAEEEAYDLVFLDYSLPQRNGLEVLERIRRGEAPPPVVMVTGLGDEQVAVEAMKGGAYDYVVKGEGYLQRLPVVTQRAVEAHRLAVERKQAEAAEELHREALAAEKERLAVTLRSIGDGVITTDTEGKIVLLNTVAENLTGWSQEETLGRPLDEVFNIINQKTRQACENPVEKVLQTGGIVGPANDTVLIARDGTERILTNNGAPILDRDNQIIGVVLVFRDITAMRKLEQELVKAQKLESVGILAGGIAHDFNNILTAVLGNISLAKMYADPAEAMFERLTQAEKACQQAKDLTQQLLTFAKGGVPVKKTVSIAELLRDSAGFALRGSNVRCQFSIPDDLWPVEVDEGQMNQVINNLIINADQAMPAGGTVEVQAENITVGAQRALPLQARKYVKMVIKDQGVGILPEHLPKIFDPYFSTKQKGSGLGLATTYSIIKGHDGYITVDSEMGVGTTFDIYLPASQKAIPIKRHAPASLPPGKGKILVMDDEETVRDVVSRQLEYIGYEADFARDGAEAIELYKRARKSGPPFDAVILDLTVPGGVGGKETIRSLLEIDPRVKAIVSSGYSNDPVMADFKRYGFSGVITKPYSIQGLGEILHKIITGERE